MDYSNSGHAGVHRSESGRSVNSSTSSKSSRNAPAVAVVEHTDEIYDETVPQPKVETKPAKQKSAKSEGSKSKAIKLKVSHDEERDPKLIATAIKVSFEDIIAEPDRGLYSFDEVWHASQTTYACCRLWWYRILTLVCGIPAACCWGISFACLSCCASWCWAPQLRYFQVVMAYVRLFVEAILGCCIEPCCFAYGKYWSRIRVVVRHEGKDEQLVV